MSDSTLERNAAARPTLGDKATAALLSHPLAALAVGVALVVSLAAGMGRLQANFTHTAFFTKSDPLLLEFNKFERQYGNDDALALVVHSPSGIFDLPSATLLATLTEGLWQVPNVIRVDSLANYSWVHSVEDDIEVEPLFPDDEPLTQEILDERKKIALSHEVLPDYLVSQDGKTALLYARIRPGFEEPPDSGVIVRKARELIEAVPEGDHQFFITGGPAVNYAFQESSQRDMQTLLPLVLLMAVLFLVFLLRAIGGVVLPFVIITVSVTAAMGAGGWFGVELSSVTLVLPQVLIAVAIADSVHILSTFYGARRRGLEKDAAVHYTLSKNFVPTLLTSLSTAAGFFAFSTSQLKPVLGLGFLAGVGTIVAWFATYLIMGPLLHWSPSYIKAKNQKETLKIASPRMTRYTALLFRWRFPIIGGYALICAGAIALATTNSVNSDPYKYFAEDYPLRQAHDFIIENLSGVAGFELSIDSGAEEGVKDPQFLRRVDEFQKRAVAIPGISKAVSIVDVLKQTNRSLNGDRPEAYVLPDDRELVAQELFLYTMSLPQGMDINDRVTVQNDALRVTLISLITDSNRWTDTAAELEALGREMGLGVKVSGKTRLYQSMNGYVTRSFIQSFLIAVVLVSFILIVSFKSLRLGLLAMIPNLVPLIIGGAMLKVVGHTLDIGTVLVCSVCLGIAVDDTIHILTSYQRYRREGKDAHEAVALTLTHTGPALWVTTLVLIAAFGTLAFATFIPNVYFGIMTATILAAALLTDFTFLPAILMLRSRAPAAAEQPGE